MVLAVIGCSHWAKVRYIKTKALLVQLNICFLPSCEERASIIVATL